MIGAYFLAGIAMLLAGVVAAFVNAVDPWAWGRWLALHLIFVGGISQLVLGASQFFVGAFLATDPPGRGRIRAQLGCWNLGAVLLAIAVPIGSKPLVWLAVACLLAGLLLYGSGLLAMRRDSLQAAPWATRWYLAAAGALGFGIVAGILLATHVVWAHGDLLGAHMALNVAGWFGTAIVGTLHTFYPSLTGTRLRHPRLERMTFAAWTGGIAVLATSLAISDHVGAVAGWLLLLAAAVMLMVNLLASARTAQQHSAAACLVGGAQAFLVAATFAGLALTVGGEPWTALLGEQRVMVAALAVAGWIGLTVAGSLLHLLALMARVRRLDRPARPATRERLTVLAGVAVAAGVLGAVAGLGVGAALLLTGGYAILGSRIAVLAARATRAAPVRV